jgi:CheY-like chemotaxis protein
VEPGLTAGQPLVVALADDLFFQEPISQGARAAGFQIVFAAPTDAADPAGWLAARQPHLVIVDLGARTLDWERWVTACKTAPATRRIPLLAFGAHTDAALFERARRAGCDAVLSNGAFKADVARHIGRHARAPADPVLERQSAEPLPELARRGIALFNQSAFYEQHQALEEAWRDEPGPVRQLYQGILQVGVAYYHIQRRNYAGARALLQRSRQYLAVLPDTCQGVDVAQLRRDADAVHAELERLGPDRIAEFSPVFFKSIEVDRRQSTVGEQARSTPATSD